MELKKNPKVDLQNRKGIFLEIGLIIALGIVIGAFSVNQKEQKIENFAPVEVVETVDLVDITTQEELKPETPPQKQTVQVITDILQIVDNDTKIETEFTFVDFDNFEDVEIAPIEIEEEEIEEEEIFMRAEEMPTFQGGDITKFREWVMRRFRYPAIAQENGIQGKVTLQFVVEKDGSVTNIQVLQTPDPVLSDEVVRVVNDSPKWKPGKQRNEPVRVKYILPVDFRIQN
ncbi:MAG: energy transducer TonB [Tidjanibacter sp.]|nr:energy transducer TonB [Tidjanibacter sp.]